MGKIVIPQGLEEIAKNNAARMGANVVKMSDFDNQRITNTYDSLIQFQRTYFINLVIGALNSIVSKDKKMTKKEKKQKISEICKHEDVVSALKMSKVSGFKKKTIVKLIKFKWKTLLYCMFSVKKS